MTGIITTLGRKSSDELGMILPHEHIFVDLRTWNTPGYTEAEVEQVIQLMAPEIEKAQAAGVTAIVECSTVGVGRRADIDRAVSEAAKIPLVIPTGIYREPWIPDWAHAATEAKLAEWMLSELQDEIEESGVQAGWIKLSAGDDGLTTCETKILRAAANVGQETNAVIGSHTIQGRVVRDQLDIIEQMGYSAERFIWIHTQAEPDFELHLEMARRGAWLEYDSIGNPEWRSDEYLVEHIQRLLDAGFGDQLLLSHDRGWFDPALPGGGVPKPYTYLSDHFLPKLRAVGVDEATIHQLTHINPFRAFAR
ncbi:MAG: phosphotriesterase [Anaerolineales bacterium]|nr:phosphotriesterase [Anaerolineales bacterium]